MKRVGTGLLASLLMLCLLWTAFPVSATTDTRETPATNDGQSDTAAITPENTPPGLSAADAAEQGFAERVYSAENDLYSAVLSDGNGNYTLFYYDSPIKYVDEDGVVRDKILQPVAQADGSYRTRQSDILTTFSPNLSDGITLERAEQSIRLTPLKAEARAALTADSARVAYAVDATTRYEYTLTPMGFKEDIIVESYTGQTEYSFLLETDGLTLIEEYGTYHLVDEYNTVQAYLGEIILFTADDRNNTFGQMQAQTIEEGQEYLLTVELDEDWLSDPDTHYPITVDPTVNYSTTGDIEDVTLDSTKTYAGDSGSIYVGRNSDGAKRRALMRFPKLNIIGYNVTSASVSIRDLMCEGTTLRVECREYTGNSWSESGTTTWSSAGSSAGGSVLSYQNISYDIGNAFTEKHRYTFDITTLAKKWATGTSSPSKGIVFRTTDSHEASSSTDGRTFASINRGSNPPRLTVTYTNSIKLNMTDFSLKEGESCTLSATTIPSGLSVSWSADMDTFGGKVELTPSGTSCKVSGINLGQVRVTASASDPNGTLASASCMIYIVLQDGVYTLQTAGSHLYATTDGINAYKENQLESNIFQNTQNPSSRNQYWRIHYSGEGRYTIRSMTDVNLGLCMKSDEKSVYLKQIGTKDSLSVVPENALWTINGKGGYYSIRSALASNKVLAAPIGDVNNRTALYVEQYDGRSYQLWFHPQKVDNSPYGLTLYYFKNGQARVMGNNNNISVDISSSQRLYAAFYSGGVIQQDYSWKISGTSASVNSNGVVNAFDRGTSTLTVTNEGTVLKLTITITISTKLIYGDRDYDDLSDKSDEEIKNINCHGYAFKKNEIIYEWYNPIKDYLAGYDNYGDDYPDSVKRNATSMAKKAFENWMDENNYYWKLEDFSDNGSHVALTDVQFRVAFRIGIHPEYYYRLKVRSDFHFWYQTYTGQWADKHGTSNIVELLDYGVTPYSDDSDGWKVGSISRYYDQTVYVYIVWEK